MRGIAPRLESTSHSECLLGNYPSLVLHLRSPLIFLISKELADSVLKISSWSILGSMLYPVPEFSLLSIHRGKKMPQILSLALSSWLNYKSASLMSIGIPTLSIQNGLFDFSLPTSLSCSLPMQTSLCRHLFRPKSLQSSLSFFVSSVNLSTKVWALPLHYV